MSDDQSKLTEWTAGFIDGDGSISQRVSVSDKSIGYETHPRVQVSQSYVAGIFDAEGSVGLHPAENDNKSINYNIKPSCRLSQYQTYSGVREKLSAFADSIDIDYSIHEKDKSSANRRPAFGFEINSRSSVQKFLREVLPYLTVKREQALIMCEKIIPLLQSGTHNTRRGFLQVMYWKDRLDEGKGGNRGKYNLEYFEDKWDMTVSETD